MTFSERTRHCNTDLNCWLLLLTIKTSLSSGNLNQTNNKRGEITTDKAMYPNFLSKSGLLAKYESKGKKNEKNLRPFHSRVLKNSSVLALSIFNQVG